MKRLIVTVAALALFAVEGSAFALSTNTISVSATVNGTCKFSSGTSTLAFGLLDPAVATDAIGTVNPTFWCTKGAAYSIANDLGAHASGTAIRMQHATILTEFIPYTLAYTGAGSGLGKSTPVTLAVTGTILNADYVNAAAGNYTDTVVLTITP